MKRKVIAFAIAIALLVCNTPMTYASDKPQNKPIADITAILGYVAHVDSDCTVYVDTIDGNGWVLDNRQDLQKGKTYIIVYDTKGNMDLYDDEIIKVIAI